MSWKWPQLGFFLLCSLLFAMQLIQILDQYQSKVTNTAISYTTHETLPLPSMTVCPKVPFKTEPDGPFLREADYIDNSFDSKDLLWFPREEEQWEVKESRLRLQGRCFTLRHKNEITPAAFAAHMGLAPNVSFNLAFHSDGDEIWLYEGITPQFIQWQSFDSEGGSIVGGDVHIVKKVSTVMSRPDAPCKNYQDSWQANKCLRGAIKQYIQSNFSCWEPTIKLQANTSSIPPCNTLKEVNQMRNNFALLMRDLAKAPQDHGCLFDCTSTSFVVSMNAYHQKSEAFSQTKSLGAVLFLIYDKNTVEIRQEMLVYDVPRLLSAIGGSMGLFLGFSLLAAMTEMYELWRRYCRKSNMTISVNNRLTV